MIDRSTNVRRALRQRQRGFIINPFRFGGGGEDPYFGNVSALLHFDGTDGSTTFTDVTGRVWTPGGDAKISTTGPKFGTGCGLFDGDGDYLTTASSDGFAFGTGDYCMEAWVNIAGDTGQNQFIFNWAGNWGIYVNPSRQFFIWNGSSNVLGPAGSFNYGEYFHLAHSREGGVMRLHVNGTRIGSNVTNNTNFGASAFYLSYSPGLRWMNGRMDELRVTKGVARYSSGNFTPPSAPFPNS